MPIGVSIPVTFYPPLKTPRGAVISRILVSSIRDPIISEIRTSSIRTPQISNLEAR